ncbi:unnamed protein product [Effrenium voratum]|uniref:PIPK domain-containing protein n=1 Tax=Effrenium voratum TaxID=2562239 RepID=A0AA36J4F9_9DINO|nr:unnamed protein product [Effrenium voratum]
MSETDNPLMDDEAPPDIRPAGRDVELFNEPTFRALRALALVPDDFANSGWDFSGFRHGGGKGGSMMAFVEDKFIIKERHFACWFSEVNLVQELSAGDHKSLLHIAPLYGEHVISGDTLLSPIFLHFRDIATGKFFFAMRNSIGQGPFKACYDLKGCADDKLLEKEGAILSRAACGSFSPWEQRYTLDATLRMRRDTAFLVGHNLMDYSFLVAIKDCDATNEDWVLKPYQLDLSVYVSIIDFLQATIPPKDYGHRFLTHFSRCILAADDEDESEDVFPGAAADEAGFAVMLSWAPQAPVDSWSEQARILQKLIEFQKVRALTNLTQEGVDALATLPPLGPDFWRQRELDMWVRKLGFSTSLSHGKLTIDREDSEDIYIRVSKCWTDASLVSLKLMAALLSLEAAIHVCTLPPADTAAVDAEAAPGQTTWAGQRLLSAFAALRRLAFGVHAASIELTDEQEIRMACSVQINGIISSFLAVSQYISDANVACPAPQDAVVGASQVLA